MKPKIGIPECFKFENYKYAVKKHDGKVKKLYIGDEVDIAKIDGLLLPGGIDIHPDYYHEKKHAKTIFADDKVRDEFEISLFNEAMGGSLYQHIPDQIPETLPPLFPDFPIHKKLRVDTQHDIKITAGSRLYQII